MAKDYTQDGIRTHEVFRPGSTKTIKVELPTNRFRFPQIPPFLTIALGFVALILVGAILLSLPFARAEEGGAPFLTALFTSTSAISGTGLAIVETGEYWSAAGQVIIMILLQLGAFGFMCSSSLLLILLGKRIGIRERTLTRQSLDMTEDQSLSSIMYQILIFTAFSEAAGMLLLFIGFSRYFATGKALWYAGFLSVSAFTNGGMDIFGTGDSLAAFYNDPLILITITIVAILGAISFIVVADCFLRGRGKRMHIDTKIVLVMTVLLIFIGTLLFFFVEGNNPATLGPYPLGEKLLLSFFHSAATRTAGLSAIDFGGIRSLTILVFAVLMSFGGVAGSTCGGIKINNIGLLLYATISTLKGHEHPHAFGKELSSSQVYKAMAITLIYFIAGLITTVLLMLTDGNMSFSELFFESYSALGTVGASMGITAALSVPGKFIIMVVMFSGRLGPMTIASILMSRNKYSQFRYPVEFIRMG